MEKKKHPHNTVVMMCAPFTSCFSASIDCIRPKRTVIICKKKNAKAHETMSARRTLCETKSFNINDERKINDDVMPKRRLMKISSPKLPTQNFFNWIAWRIFFSSSVRSSSSFSVILLFRSIHFRWFVVSFHLCFHSFHISPSVLGIGWKGFSNNRRDYDTYKETERDNKYTINRGVINQR